MVSNGENTIWFYTVDAFRTIPTKRETGVSLVRGYATSIICLSSLSLVNLSTIPSLTRGKPTAIVNLHQSWILIPRKVFYLTTNVVYKRPVSNNNNNTVAQQPVQRLSLLNGFFQRSNLVTVAVILDFITKIQNSLPKEGPTNLTLPRQHRNFFEIPRWVNSEPLARKVKSLAVSPTCCE